MAYFFDEFLPFDLEMSRQPCDVRSKIRAVIVSITALDWNTKINGRLNFQRLLLNINYLYYEILIPCVMK